MFKEKVSVGTWSSDKIPAWDQLPDGGKVYEQLLEMGFDYKIVASFIYCVHANLGLVVENVTSIADVGSEATVYYYNRLCVELLDSNYAPNIFVRDPEGKMTIPQMNEKQDELVKNEVGRISLSVKKYETDFAAENAKRSEEYRVPLRGPELGGKRRSANLEKGEKQPEVEAASVRTLGNKKRKGFVTRETGPAKKKAARKAKGGGDSDVDDGDESTKENDSVA